MRKICDSTMPPMNFCNFSNIGPVAQRIRHLTTNQGIPGSSPGRIGSFDQPATKLESHQKALPDKEKPCKNSISVPGAYYRCRSRKTILRFLTFSRAFFIRGRSRDHASNSNRVDHDFGKYFAHIRFFCQTHFFIFFELFRSCGPMDKASDYESGDSRFESWQDRKF